MIVLNTRVACVALAGWFGSDNLGDELILKALISAVRQRNAKPVTISIRADPPVAADTAMIVHSSPAHQLRLVKALRSMDAMVMAGGLVQTETSPWNVPFHMSRIAACNTQRCAVATLGLGVGMVSNRLNRTFVRKSLNSAEVVVVRDQDSADRLSSWGVLNVKVGADPVFGLEPAVHHAHLNADYFCVILRTVNRKGLKTAASKNRNSKATLADTDLRRLAEAIDAVAAATSLTPKFVAFQASRDSSIHHAVAARMKADAVLTEPKLDTIFTEIAQSQLVITMRYHGAVAALMHGKPTVTLNYSPKMVSLAAEGHRAGDAEGHRDSDAEGHRDSGWAASINPYDVTSSRLMEAVSAAFTFSTSGKIELARNRIQTRLSHNEAALDALISAALY